MKANAKQKQLIHVNAPTRDIKEEFVQWATEDVNKISCNDLSFDQANAILIKLGQKPVSKSSSGYKWIDMQRKDHKKIYSIMMQLQWMEKSEKYGWVASKSAFQDFIASKKAPKVKTTDLLKMDPKDISKVITALEGNLSKYK
jgi:hypothetical protein